MTRDLGGPKSIVAKSAQFVAAVRITTIAAQ
jgi:hypothetical protein